MNKILLIIFKLSIIIVSNVAVFGLLLPYLISSSYNELVLLGVLITIIAPLISAKLLYITLTKKSRRK